MMRPFLIALAFLCLVPSVRADEADFDRWFVLLMQGQRAGWAHMTQATEGERVTTTNQMKIALKRGPIEVQVEQAQRFVETPGGKPIEADSTVKMGAMAMNSAYRFIDANNVEVTSGQGGQSQTRTQAIEGEWLTPAAAQRFIEKEIASGAKEIKLRTIDLSMGVQPIDASMKLVGEENIEVFGKTVPAIVWEGEVAAAPGMKMREYVDEEGRTLKTTMALMPGMELEMLAADEALAKSPVDPPEVLASLLIRPTGAAITDARHATSAVYEVKAKAGSGIESLDLPRAGYQHVVFGDAGTARVVVDLSRPVNPVDDVPNDEHLAASAVLNHEDEKVRELVAQAIPANARLTPEGTALALRKFVHDYLTEKSLAIGFATASEVARTREGDCSEHAVLLAALLRAAEIPSRVATGLVYVDEFVGQDRVFGGHMWAQAWIAPAPGNSGNDDGNSGGRWIDLDATLPDTAFDAAHITLGVATMDDDALVNELMVIAPLVAGLDIEVVEIGGAAAVAPEPEPAGAAE